MNNKTQVADWHLSIGREDYHSCKYTELIYARGSLLLSVRHMIVENYR